MPPKKSGSGSGQASEPGKKRNLSRPLAKPAEPQPIPSRQRRQRQSDDQSLAPDPSGTVRRDIRQRNEDFLRTFDSPEEQKRLAEKPLPSIPSDEDDIGAPERDDDLPRPTKRSARATKQQRIDPTSFEARGEAEEGASGSTGRRVRARDRSPPFVPPSADDLEVDQVIARRRQGIDFDADRVRIVEEDDDSREREPTTKEIEARNERAAAEIEQIGREVDKMVVRVHRETTVHTDEQLSKIQKERRKEKGQAKQKGQAKPSGLTKFFR